ncbi:MAG: malto-oligosyltrehalose synthase [Terrimesophilobacter sp.]
MRVPASTYRLQIRASFGLEEAAGVLDYVHALGAGWVYLSPLLRADEGSDHGYDVVDHERVDPARGGNAGLDVFAARARDLGLGVLVDIVPNHMGIAHAAANSWWWDVLKHGSASSFAEAFDIDWEFGSGRVRLPVLGDGPAELDALRIVGGELHYFDHRFPIAPATADDGADPRTVHDRQHYELIDWRRADSESNYRRFFAVNTLAGLRVEVPWVFQKSHAEILRWVRSGLVDGLRVDHPDGLADPGGYLDMLAEATGGAYIIVEKILEGSERLPASWPVAGTTGYDALADVDRVLVDAAGQQALDKLDATLRDRPEPPSWGAEHHSTKRAVADGILRSEVLRLARDVRRAGFLEAEPELLADALAELLTCFPVYRSYLPLGVEWVRDAAETAKRYRPELTGIIDELQPLLTDPAHPAAVRFQQTSGMVMAKGVEDCAFYRYTRLGSLTEVGADPEEFAIHTNEYHRRNSLRQAGSPLSMTTLSTHDTKRGEDVRARISVLAEIPEEWTSALSHLRELAPLGDGPLESLLWQAILGAWPATRERLHAYAEKASREAGNSTSWDRPNERFESRMHALIDSAFDNPEVEAIVGSLVRRVQDAGWSNSLSAKLLQLAAPGVPDVYQGSEFWERSLVDPDNRRPVDFTAAESTLRRLDGGELPPIDASGDAKLLVTSRALRLRRDQPELFTRYLGVPAFGAAARHVVAFDRGGAVAVATRLPIGLASKGGWRDTSILLSRQQRMDVITGRRFDGGELEVAQLLERYPIALLAPLEQS